MKPKMTMESLTTRLLDALDLEAQHLRMVTEFLATLSRMILKRDEAGLRDLFSRVHEETLVHESNESLRHELMVSLADLAGCPVSAVTLSMLERLVPAHQERQIQKRRQDLRKIVDELRKQHYGTTMLLGEMIRINRSLLAGITGGCNSTTYGRGGQAKWAGADNILNLRY
jgi:flagellar biosynthesis/type III secretory pathway chaperone